MEGRSCGFGETVQRTESLVDHGFDEPDRVVLGYQLVWSPSTQNQRLLACFPKFIYPRTIPPIQHPVSYGFFSTLLEAGAQPPEATAWEFMGISGKAECLSYPLAYFM